MPHAHESECMLLDVDSDGAKGMKSVTSSKAENRPIDDHFVTRPSWTVPSQSLLFLMLLVPMRGTRAAVSESIAYLPTAHVGGLLMGGRQSWCLGHAKRIYP